MTMDSTVVMVTASSTRPSCPWRSRIVRFAVTQRTPAMYGFREFVSDGGLLSYEPNLIEMFRRSATYAARIPECQ